MKFENDLPYWMALSQLPNWGNERINRLLIELLHNKKISFAEFFELDAENLKAEFGLSFKEAEDVLKAKEELPNYAFLAESLAEQGFHLIPIDSKEYSQTLKQNLKVKDSPPLLYVKGNITLLHEDSVAIVGSRNASPVALEFTKNIAKNCVERNEIIVSGFAKGVDRTALEATLEYDGRSIIVLPQGILTFGSGIKKYYRKIIDGDILILSTFQPKAPWSVGLAMQRNTYIYGLANTIYVAESDTKGGTWNGALNGLKRGLKVFVRQPQTDEKNGNNLLILKGGIPVDLFGKRIDSSVNTVEDQLKKILANGPLPAGEIASRLNVPIETKELQKLLLNLSFVDSKRIKSKKYYFLKETVKAQLNLFNC